MTKSTLRSVLSRVLFAAVTAVLGAFIGSRVEPTWRALVGGEDYRIGGKLAKQDVGPGWAVEAIQAPPRTGPANPVWAWVGGALGLGLGVVGRRWRVRARAIPLLLGTLLGMVVGEISAAASVKPRDPVTADQADRVLAKGAILGGAIGFTAALLLGSTWTASPQPPGPSSVRAGVPPSGCALAVDLDPGRLPVPPDEAGREVARVLGRHGLTERHGLYLGGDPVACTLAAADLARSLPWFAAAARDVRMVQATDLMPAVRSAT